MRTLTNDYRDCELICELINLGFGPSGRGTYIIRQDGVTKSTR